MANETVLFKRGDSATITSTPVTDGQILFDTSGNGKMYLDNGTDRLEMGGALTVDATLSKTSTNPVQNKAVAGVMLDTLSDISIVTRKGFLTDALAVKELNTNVNELNDSLGKLNKKIYTLNTGGTLTVDVKPITDKYGSLTDDNFILVNSYILMNKFTGGNKNGALIPVSFSMSYDAVSGILTIDNTGGGYHMTSGDVITMLIVGDIYLV